MVKMFSYGSNMSLARLHVNDRAPSATIVGIAHIKWFILKFNKIGKSFSKGNSGKANIEETGNENDIVWGVIYEITGDEKDQLDIVEKGYHISNLVFTSATGVVSAYTYIANVDAIDNNDALALQRLRN